MALRGGTQAAQRLEGAFVEPPSPDSDGSKPFVELQDVSLAYGGADGVLALAKTSLSIRRGEFIAVVGPSGCGKSSLLKLISGLHLAMTGSVLVDEKPVTGTMKICGMAFQNATLLPWRTTIDNVLLPLEVVEPHASRFRKHRGEYEERARELLAAVGLKGFEHRFPWELSGGMQQRSSLCRALIHSPEMLLLDEPFAALDPFTREELWDVVQKLWLDRRPTVLLVTHDLREAVYLADTIYMFSARPGRIIARTEIGFPRPRRLADTFRPEFTDLVQQLRTMIAPGSPT